MKIAYFYLTKQGEQLTAKLQSKKPGTVFGRENFKENLGWAFANYDALICVMATGIVIRTLAPLLADKTKDPAVLVLDQAGQYVISLLSGHIGGANELAVEIAALTGGQAVITTATDVSGKLAFDVFARKNRLAIENIEELRLISTALVDGSRVDVLSNEPIFDIFDEQIHRVEAAGENPLVVIDEKLYVESKYPVLYLRPKNIHVGVGCTKNRDKKAISAALAAVLKEEKILPCRVESIATISLKAKEEGIIALAREYRVPLRIISKERVEALDLDELCIQQSAFVRSITGVPSVATACAYLSSYRGKILKDKEKFKGITISIAKRENKIYQMREKR